jgi:hypothetical protein
MESPYYSIINKKCEVISDTTFTKDTNSKLKTTTFDVGSDG